MGDFEDVAVADLDGDGDPDLVFAAEDDQQAQLWLNDGTDRFTDATGRLPARGTSNAVVAADVDGDGDADLVFGNQGGDFLFINDGAGNFSNQSAQRLPPHGSTTWDVAAGDVDGDGDRDLVFGNQGADHLLLNDGTGHFTTAPAARFPTAGYAEETRGLLLKDLDGDGDLDVYFANVRFQSSSNPQDRVLLNDGAGVFTDATAAKRGPDGSPTTSVGALDVDGDGDLDLVTSSFSEGSMVSTLLNQGALVLGESSSVLPGGITGDGVDLEVADVNGDGKQDVLVCAYRGGNRLLLRK